MAPTVTRYSVGFAFSANRQFVALIQKNRPKWQAGKLNGIGGHVEGDEAFAITQQREFWEETGVVIPSNEWNAFATLIGPDWHVRCFSAYTDATFDVRSMTDEEVKVLPVDKLNLLPIIPNLSYLVPLALDDEHVGVPMFHYGNRKVKLASQATLEEVLGEAPIAVTTAKVS